MMSIIKFALVLSNVLLLTTCQTWSSWSTCESIPNCFRRRVLTCDDGEGIQCAKDKLYEQRAVPLSINGCDGICIDDNSSRINNDVSTSICSKNVKFMPLLTTYVWLNWLS